VALICCDIVVQEVKLNSRAVQCKLNGFDPYTVNRDRLDPNYVT
jgi:hypothetical protein